MNLIRNIKQDIAQMKERFPKMILLNNDGKPPSFKGVIDICDESGEWYGSFDVLLIASKRYPYGVPRMFEIGGLIERIPDRHVNYDGSSCVGMDHVLLHRAAKGLSMNIYMEEFAWPYFANQLFFKDNGRYAAGEYAHGFAGVQQFYKESLDIPDIITAIQLLHGILHGKLPLRNEKCFCGSAKKFKKCHLKAAGFLKSVGNLRLADDLASFEYQLKI